MNYNHQSTFSTVQMTPSSFCIKDPRDTHSSKKSQQTQKVSSGHMVPGWSRSVPVQLIFFNSYTLNTFLYDKNLAWALRFILNKIYEIFITVNTKILIPSLLHELRKDYIPKYFVRTPSVFKFIQLLNSTSVKGQMTKF